jgi:hypothetical protein
MSYLDVRKDSFQLLAATATFLVPQPINDQLEEKFSSIFWSYFPGPAFPYAEEQLIDFQVPRPADLIHEPAILANLTAQSFKTSWYIPNFFKPSNKVSTPTYHTQMCVMITYLSFLLKYF